MRVVLAGGGSAGHIEPALALADALRQADSSIQVTCLGTQRGLETRLVPLRGYELALIPAVPLPRSVTPQLLTVPGRLAGAVHAVGTVLDRVRADVLVGFGGYVATPAYLAAKRHKVPIVVHEANPLAGIANRLGAHLTTHVFTGHPDTKLRNGRYIGLPIRRQIAELDRFALGDKARAHFGLRPDLPVLLVTGGSQGAMSLNRALAGAVAAITASGVQVLHVTGPKHLNEIQPPAGPVPYVAVPYVDQMDLAYAAADFALCRAGAMTCAELTAVGLPAAYVPLPHGNGEQRLNALPIVQRGGGLLVDDAELSADWIKTSLLPVLTNIDQVAGMSEAAAAMGRRDADRQLAKAVMDVVAAETGPGQAAGGQPAPRPATPPAAADPRPFPAPPPAQPAPPAEPGSLFTPRAPGGHGSPSAPPAGPAPEEPGSLFTPRRQQGGGRPPAGGPGAGRQFPSGQLPGGMAEPDQLPTRRGQSDPPGPGRTTSARAAQPPASWSPRAQSPAAPSPAAPSPAAPSTSVQPPQSPPFPGQSSSGQSSSGQSGPAPSLRPSQGPGRHRQARP